MPLMVLAKIQRKPLEEKWGFFKFLEPVLQLHEDSRRNPGSVCAPDLAPETSSGDGPVQPLPPSCSGVPAWAGGAGKIGRFPGIFLHSCSPAADYCCHMSCFTAKPSCLHELRRSLGDRGLRGQTHRPPLPLPPPPQRDTGLQEKRSQGKGGWSHLHGLRSAITGLTQCEGQEGDPRAEPPAVH